jgi:signal transduction histidine kinase
MDLQEPIALALSMVARDVRSRARIVESHRSAPPIFGDRSKLCQALVNLLLNAAEAIPPGEPESNDVRIATFTDGRGRAVVEIQDTGVGVPEALRDRLFEPFVSQPSASGKGPGLGLSICRTIVHDLGGEIEFEPAPERGTTFRITLPPAERDA